MAGAWVQISAFAGCAGVTLYYVIQFTVMIWSLRTNEEGRRHALRLLLALRGGRPRRRLPPGTPRLPSPKARVL